MEDKYYAQLQTLPNGCVFFLGGRGISPETKSKNPNMPGIVRAELDKVIDRAYQRGRRCFIASSRTVFESYAAEQVLQYQKVHPDITLVMIEPVNMPNPCLEFHAKASLAGCLFPELDAVDGNCFQEYLDAVLPHCAEIVFNYLKHGRLDPLIQLTMDTAEPLSIRQINLNIAIRGGIYQKKEKNLLLTWFDYGDDNPLEPFFTHKHVSIPYNSDPSAYLPDRIKTAAFYGGSYSDSFGIPPPYLVNAYLSVLRKAIDQALERGRRVFLINADSDFAKIAAYLLVEKKKQIPDLRILDIEAACYSDVGTVDSADYACGLSSRRNPNARHRLSEFLLAHSAEIIGCLPEKVYPQAWIVKRKDDFDCPFLNLGSEFMKYRQKENWAAPYF